MRKAGGVGHEKSIKAGFSEDEWGKYGKWLMLRMNQAYSKAIRLREMPPEWFEIPADVALVNPLAVFVRYMHCMRLFDMHEFDAAYEKMKELLETAPQMPGTYKFSLLTAMVFCELIGECRPEVLETLISEQTARQIRRIKCFESIRTRYAFALIAGNDTKSASGFHAQFAAMEKNYPYPFIAEGERELMDIIAQRHAEIVKEQKMLSAQKNADKPIEKQAEWHYSEATPWR